MWHCVIVLQIIITKKSNDTDIMSASLTISPPPKKLENVKRELSFSLHFTEQLLTSLRWFVGLLCSCSWYTRLNVVAEQTANSYVAYPPAPLALSCVLKKERMPSNGRVFVSLVCFFIFSGVVHLPSGVTRRHVWPPRPRLCGEVSASACALGQTSS